MLKQIIKDEFLSHLNTINLTIKTIEENLVDASLLVVETLKNGNKVII